MDPAAVDITRLALDVADTITTFGLMVLIVTGAVMEWWVPGRRYREVVKERDEMRDLAFKLAAIGEQSTTLQETVMDLVDSRLKSQQHSRQQRRGSSEK